MSTATRTAARTAILRYRERRSRSQPTTTNATTTRTATRHGPFVDRSIIRSRAGIRAVALSLVVLTFTAAAQTAIYVLVLSVALLADLIHNFGDALTAIPLGLAFFLRSTRGERWAGFAVVLHDLRERMRGAGANDPPVHSSSDAHTPVVARGGRRDRFRRQRDRSADSITRG